MIISNILPDETASLQGQLSVNWSGLTNPLRPPPAEQGYCFAFLLIFSQPPSGLPHTVVLQGELPILSFGCKLHVTTTAGFPESDLTTLASQPPGCSEATV